VFAVAFIPAKLLAAIIARRPRPSAFNFKLIAVPFSMLDEGPDGAAPAVAETQSYKQGKLNRQ
jgi:hypothetical protein